MVARLPDQDHPGLTATARILTPAVKLHNRMPDFGHAVVQISQASATQFLTRTRQSRLEPAK